VLLQPPSVDAADARAAMELALNNIEKELGVRIRIAEQQEISESDLETESFEALRARILAHRSAGADLLYVCLPGGSAAPLLGFGYQGYAEGVGLVGRRKDGLILSRMSSSQVVNNRVMMHELGHMLGAGHAWSGLMIFDSTLIQLASGYSAASVGEIRRALQPSASSTAFISYSRSGVGLR
jgi:hypothetical protein